MKSRKIFLDGYVELSPKLFKAARTFDSFVIIYIKRGFIGVSEGSLQLAKVNAPSGEFVNVRLALHKSNDKFAIVFDEDGIYKTRRFGKAMIRINGIGVIRRLIECGFRANKRYKVTSPEAGVIVVAKEDVDSDET